MTISKSGFGGTSEAKVNSKPEIVLLVLIPNCDLMWRPRDICHAGMNGEQPAGNALPTKSACFEVK